jgi:hypothetical protein
MSFDGILATCSFDPSGQEDDSGQRITVGCAYLPAPILYIPALPPALFDFFRGFFARFFATKNHMISAVSE